MKGKKISSKEENGTHKIIQRKQGKSFVKPKGAQDSFTPPIASAKQNKHLPSNLQSNMETSLGHDFSNVGIHTNSQKAVQMNARAFTQGEQVHFAPGEFNPNSSKGQDLIGHEFTHVAQQRAGVVKPTKVLQKGIVINDNKSLESEADSFGKKAARGEAVSKYRSAGLGMRSSLRTAQAKSLVIQRDIKGSKELGYGKMELDFTKNEATAVGGRATESGTVKFTPSKFSPRSNNIRLIQIVRTTDTSGATEKDYKWTGGEANRNKVMTKSDSANNVAGGFFIDHLAAGVSPRTNKADATVSPYYRDHAPNIALSQDGYSKSVSDIKHASLWDAPGDAAPGRFLFVTTAKAADTGQYYGTALWGFEIYHDKAGIAKIKGEYKRFREYRGKTFDKALENFNDFYKNPGTSGAPTK